MSKIEFPDYLFFDCFFTKGIQVEALKICLCSKKIWNRDVEVQWAINKREGESLESIIIKLAWATTPYNI